MSEDYAGIRYAFTLHAQLRCLERFGESPSVDEQWGMVRAIEAAKAPLLTDNSDRNRKRRKPVYLVPWPRKETELAVVFDTTSGQVITVLRPGSFEEKRWREKQAATDSAENAA